MMDTKSLFKNIKPIYRLYLSIVHGYYDAKMRKQFRWMHHQMNMIDPCSDKRQKYWIKCGAHIDGQINIGAGVYFDASNADHIYIGEKTWIASRSLILCHQRDLSSYYYGEIADLPYIVSDVRLGKGVHIGMDTVIMPGVSIGDGAIVGAGSLVTKDIPAWTVSVGRPAKVIKEIPKKDE